jgi:curved DNA-binding protein CbpA/Tfp pilus assembly protein PilF
MKSHYDLLGGRENDDADALKKAFRRAIKANHPDLHPGDPDAAERFREIVAANACLRDPKQRASYDLHLQRERQWIQAPTLKRQQRRSKRMRTTAVIAAVSALIVGYGLWATMPTIGNVETDKDELAAAAGAAVEKQTATVVAAAKESENPPTAIAAAKVDGVQGNFDNAGKPVEATDAKVMAPTGARDQGDRRDKHDNTEVPSGASKPRTDKHDDAQIPIGTDKPNADKYEEPKVLNEANELSDDAAAIMRFVMQRLRDGGEAQATAGRELALGPPANDANFYRERGIAAYGSGDFLGAIGHFDEAIRLNPNDAQSYNIRGNVWDELGLLERALADYGESIRINPSNPAVFRDRAILWHRKGALDKALVDLDSAIRFSFAKANIYCDRGLVWYQKGRYDRAIADFDRAIKLDPNFAAAYINRGLILHRNGEFNVAFADSKAIRIDPGIFDVNRRTNSRH